MGNTNLISTYPSTITISATAAHGFNGPEIGTGVAQTFTEGQTFAAVGYVVVTSNNAIGNNPYWWVANGYYVPCYTTAQQPDTSIAALTTPASINNAILAAANAQVAADLMPGVVIPAGLNGIFSAVKTAATDVTTAASNLVSGVAGVGPTIVDLAWLLGIGFIIYAVISTGALNTVHFNKKKE